MKYAAAGALVLALYWLGGEKGDSLKRKAERTLKLASSLQCYADSIESHGMLASEAIEELINDPAFADLQFFSVAAEKCSAGKPLSKALAESILEQESRFSSGTSYEAARMFQTLGKTTLGAETAAIRRTAEKLYSLGDEAAESALQQKKLYRSLYAIAGAVAAVILM